MGNPSLRLVTPTAENRTVMPRRRKNADLRSREYLTEHEIEALMAAARQNRHGHRDATMILVAFRHGLRAAEAVDLRWDQVDFRSATLHVRRAKRGTPSTHPIARRRATRTAPPSTRPRTQVGLRISRRSAAHRLRPQGSPAWSNGQGAEAKLGYKAHPHMLRHACGFALANKGHDTRALQAYLGHRNIQHTVRYTELAPTRFKDFWR